MLFYFLQIGIYEVGVCKVILKVVEEWFCFDVKVKEKELEIERFEVCNVDII